MSAREITLDKDMAEASAHIQMVQAMKDNGLRTRRKEKANTKEEMGNTTITDNGTMI